MFEENDEIRKIDKEIYLIEIELRRLTAYFAGVNFTFYPDFVEKYVEREKVKNSYIYKNVKLFRELEAKQNELIQSRKNLKLNFE